MRKNSSETVFDRIQRKHRITKRIVAGVLTVAVVAGTCFGSSFLTQETQAASSSAPREYITYVVNELLADSNRKFTILEIVPDSSQGEFNYYAAQPEITGKLDWLTQAELKKTDEWYAERNSVNVYHHANNLYVADSTGTIQSATVSLLNFRTIENGITGLIDIELENGFLQCVVPEYYSLFKDRMDVRIVEANDVTVADIRNADLIYIHGHSDQGNVQPVNELLTTLTGQGSETDATVGRGEKIVNPNYEADGTLTDSDRFDFSDYEYVAFGSEEDLLYKENLAKYENATAASEVTYDSTTGVVDRTQYSTSDKEDIALATYDTSVEIDVDGDGVNDGYIKSRDMSWDVVEELWKLNLQGKYFPAADDGNGAYATLPVIVDHNGFLSDTDTNASKMTSFLEIVSAEYINPSSSASTQINGYDVFIQCVRSDFETYNPYGLRTGVFSILYFDNEDETKIYQNTTEVSTGVVTCEKTWAQTIFDTRYLGLNGTNIGSQFLKDVGTKYGFDDTWTFPNGESWDDFLLMNSPSSYSLGNQTLRDNFMAYNHDSALVPNSRYDENTNIQYYDGVSSRLTSSQYYMYELIRWILGASGNASIDPAPSSETEGATVTLDILEIEPCNDFEYDVTTEAGRTNVAQLLTDILDGSGRSYSYDSSSGKYVDSSVANATKYIVNVDCYTVNAFNGLTTDIIAEYGIVYIGTNDSTLSQINFSASKLYYPQTSTVNSNDLTDVKAQELKDYVDAGKVLLMSSDLSSSKLDSGSQMYTLLAEVSTKVNAVFRSNASMLYYIYDDGVTPTMSVTDVSVEGTSTGYAGDDIQYTTVDGISGVIDESAISDAAGFAVYYEVTNCIKDKEYAVVVYVDEDQDGIFGEDKSECKSITIATALENATTGKSGISGNASMSLPADFTSAMVSWKICVYLVDANGTELETSDGATVKVDLIERDTIVGATPIKNSAAVSGAEVKVLQIQGTSGTDFSADTDLQKYIDTACAAIDYTISIQTVDATDNSITYDAVKNTYDLIVIGTGTFNTLSAEVKSVVKQWADDDKNILFMNESDNVATISGMTLENLGQKDGTTTTGNAKSTSSVETLNDGTLTQYPYNIDVSDIAISSTSPETCQLLLDFKDATAQTQYGVVVWNTLTNGNTAASSNYFDADYKDAMNNYYLYSMGNIMYTAMNSVSTDVEKKLFVNILVRTASKGMWVSSPAIIVNNGIMTVGGYNIYVDLNEIVVLDSSEAADDKATAEALRKENYYINFTAYNYDSGKMDGSLRWYPANSIDVDGDGTADSEVVLVTYTGSNQLESGVAQEVRITDLKSTLGDTVYNALISEIDREQASFKIFAKNSDNREEEKRVEFRQRKTYNLK